MDSRANGGLGVKYVINRKTGWLILRGQAGVIFLLLAGDTGLRPAPSLPPAVHRPLRSLLPVGLAPLKRDIAAGVCGGLTRTPRHSLKVWGPRDAGVLRLMASSPCFYSFGVWYAQP